MVIRHFGLLDLGRPVPSHVVCLVEKVLCLLLFLLIIIIIIINIILIIIIITVIAIIAIIIIIIMINLRCAFSVPCMLKGFPALSASRRLPCNNLSCSRWGVSSTS